MSDSENLNARSTDSDDKFSTLSWGKFDTEMAMPFAQDLYVTQWLKSQFH
jgi:hypothetical protein